LRAGRKRELHRNARRVQRHAFKASSATIWRNEYTLIAVFIFVPEQTVGTKVSAVFTEVGDAPASGKARVREDVRADTSASQKRNRFSRSEREIEPGAFGVSTQSPSSGLANGGALKFERTTRTSADRHCPFDRSLRIPLN
jgi:hypothetical protein